MENTDTEKTYNWNDKTILVAEDTEFNFYLIRAILVKTLVNIIWAKNGQEAINKYNENKVDLILMDIRMPIKDGYEASTEIKKINASIPIIAQTAYGFEEHREKILSAGFDELILKPILPDLLLDIIDKFFNTKT